MFLRPTCLLLALLATAIASAAEHTAPGAFASASQPAATVEVGSARLPQPPPGARVMAAYMELRSKTGDRLLGAATDLAARVELHGHEMVDGVARMRRVEALELPAGSTVQLAPGGLHLMLFEPRRRPEPGEQVELELRFEHAGKLRIQLQVQDGRSTAPAAHHHH